MLDQEEENKTEESERTKEQKKANLKLIHNLYFPMQWREIIVTPQQMLLMSGEIESTE